MIHITGPQHHQEAHTSQTVKEREPRRRTHQEEKEERSCMSVDMIMSKDIFVKQSIVKKVRSTTIIIPVVMQARQVKIIFLFAKT